MEILFFQQKKADLFLSKLSSLKCSFVAKEAEM